MKVEQEKEFIHLCEKTDLKIEYNKFAYLQESVEQLGDIDRVGYGGTSFICILTI